MRDGINLFYGDGKRRWYFPRLIVFMDDYKEIWRVYDIKWNYYIIYIISALWWKDMDPIINRKNYPLRTDEESLRFRMLYKDQSEILKKYDYHIINLFTDDISFSDYSIYDSIILDLFHQISKNFYNQVFLKWWLDIIKLGINEIILTTKLNTRFQYISIYPGLWWFRIGISKLKYWIGKEYKDMIRIWMGVSWGLGGDILNSMIKEYLDIYRLSYYPNHWDMILGISENIIINQISRIQRTSDIGIIDGK
jgi:hypothetical protein